MRRLLGTLGLAALVALGSGQALIGSAAAPEAGDRWQTRLRLFASEPNPRIEASRGGALKVEIPSFGHVGRPGGVYLPTRTIRIAIPDGAGPVRLEGLRGSPSPLAGLELDPPAARRPIGTRAGPARPAASGRGPAEAEADLTPPGEPLRLGDVGWLRDQRFVEVVYTPVVSPEGGGEALFYGEVEVDVVVEGIAPGAVAEEAVPEDPAFEKAYREGLVNYDEGRYYRTRGRRAVGGADAGGAPSVDASGAAAAAPTAVTAEAAINPAFPSYKVTISKDGVYRLTQPYLLDPNTGVAPGLAGADPRQFKITNRGVEIPIFVQGEGDGVFGSGDYVEFYGQRLDGPEAILNYAFGSGPSIYQYDDYADKNVYWISVDASGTRSRAASRSAPPDPNLGLAADFQETLHFEVDNLFLPTGGDDPFLMSPRLNSNNGSVAADANTCAYANPGIPSGAPNNYLYYNPADPNRHCAVCQMTLPGINAAAPGDATVAVRFRGTTTESGVVPDHLTVVEAGGVASRSSASCWSGITFHTQTLSFPQSVLASPLNIRIEQPGLAATLFTEQAAVDWTEVTYRRLFQASADSLRFRVPDQSRRIAVSALTSNNAANVALYEITATAPPALALGGPPLAAPVRITGGTFSGSSGNFTLTFTSSDDPNSAADRVYEVAGPGALLLPDSVVQDVPSTLLDPANEADVIVLGDPNVMDTSPSSPFTAYWNHRAAADGLVVKAVFIQDVFDEFGYGIPHPEAIRAFLNYAYDDWKGPTLDPNRAPPAYVTLVGDTSADPKNVLNRADWINRVPTFVMLQVSSVLGFYASDNLIAAFRGSDQIPDVHLGRLPLRTAAEADTVFQKLLDYDTLTPPGTWRGRGTFIADKGTAAETSEFERITDEVVAMYWQPQPPHEAVKLYFDDPAFANGGDPNGFRNAIIAAHDNGNVSMQYTGHGSFQVWGQVGYFNVSHVASLAANGVYSFQINENCLSGGFHSLASSFGTTDALSEAFLKAPGKGSVAFFAPAGLSFTFIGEAINREVYGDMFGTARMRRFGPLITDVRLMLADFGSVIDLQSYTLVGDPTQEFRLPAPKPPRDLTAVSGNAEVDLSWTASLDPGVLTRIYRAQSPGGPYTLVTPSPVAGTNHTDPNLTNAAAYYYAAASVDASLFEGAWSNFNSDCVTSDLPASGPDCVWARPLNPNPPQTPAGTMLFDDGSGVRLVVQWSPNPENDLSGYTVKYGTQAGGPYPLQAAAGPSATTATLSGLTTGTPYYVVVAASNTSGLESAPSPEMWNRPTVFEGQNPPRLIGDLTIVRTPGDPNSLTLSWTRPLLDVYGDPTSVGTFYIYRDVFPGFMPSLANRIATISNPDQTSYTDVGAFAAAPDYYYLVTSADVRGYESGASTELPGGVSDLDLSVVGGSTLHFSWGAVTTDVVGGPTIVSKYVLYAAGAPITRAMVDTLAPLVDDIQATSVDTPVDPSNRYYSVIVVDKRGNKSPF